CVCVCLVALAGSSAAAGAGESGWAPRVTNTWFPLRPGTTYIYTGMRDGHPSRELFTVMRSTKVIQGVRCTAVFDRLYLRGRLFERTTDWYAQDRHGSVWYFGERTAELDANGYVTSTEGSWQSGVDGAKPGIYMSAHPRVGQSFRQELYPGHADDHFRVVSLNASVSVPYISSRHALLTKEWTPLEPGVLDHKLYVRGVGTVKEETVKGGSERNVLVAVRRG
ncbi:MAG: hypothetical protein ABI948_13170, partial [Thermoleophilia bacterium]